MVRFHRALALSLVLLIYISAIGPGLTVARAAATSFTPVAIPETPAGLQLSWVLDQVNGDGDGVTAATVTPHFAPDFLSALPAADLVGVLRNYVAPYGPMLVARFEGGVTETRANALLLAGDGKPWRVTLGVETGEPYRIDDLFFEPSPTPPAMKNPPTSWAALDKRLKKVAPAVGFIAAEVGDGSCRLIHGYQADDQLAVGSNFKLYVLGELARQIEAGEASWDEPLALKRRYKSLPSGNLLYEPDGSVFPLRHYAERMVAESDNTATDHLIARLGRKNVERMMATMGHADPESNRPLLMTREWFTIKLRFDDEQLDRYLAADESKQRRILSREVGPIADTIWDGEEWSGPHLIDSIEWFASAGDLCRAVAALHAMAERPALAPIYDALSLEPGIPFDPAAWRYVGYKGGYETGVKSDVWLLQRADGRWFALTAIINNPKKEIDGHTLRQLMVPAAALLAKE